MRQNIASLVIDAETLKAIDGTLTALEKQLEDFIELSAEQHTKLKIYATKQGKSIKELLTEYVDALPE